MQTKSEGKIFLSGERGHTETDWFRSYASFNFGAYQNEHKKPFGPLYVFNDETLAGGRSVELSVEDDSLVMVLPLVGSIEVESSSGQKKIVEVAQAQLLFQPAGSSFHVANPYAEDPVNYLQVWIKAEVDLRHTTGVSSFSTEGQNKLVDLFPPVQNEGFYLRAMLGKFDGRKEASYALQSGENGVMAFVVQGAFEVENRLLEERDGLALWETEGVEMEALSNGAIILLIEIKLVNLGPVPEGSFPFVLE